ncbi:unnamed protein product [Spirodela intermedia]|uniref:Pentatricopeptide repeat-containing protein n=1 Tax=Spirodela intermedia TaxID=51605 RepID=A0ABN7EAZ4_SPIIN|nr:unnamed protein product [Spirodela intermedia]
MAEVGSTPYLEALGAIKALQFYSMVKEFQNALPESDAANRMLVRRCRYETARKVYDEMLQAYGVVGNFSTSVTVGGPNAVFFNKLMDGCCKKGDVEKARSLFREVQF